MSRVEGCLDAIRLAVNMPLFIVIVITITYNPLNALKYLVFLSPLIRLSKMRNFNLKILILCIALGSSNAMAQKARSLFDSGTGVAIDSNANAVNEMPASKNLVANPSANNPPPTANTTQVNNPAKTSPEKSKERFVGLSYTVFQEMPNGELKKVSPDTSFKTGDRIKVEVMSNLSGRLMVANIGPQGDFNEIGAQQVTAKKPISVPENGFLKFVGTPGKEQLMFVLADPKLAAKPASAQKVNASSNLNWVTIASDCQKKPASRSLVVDDSAGNQYQVLSADGSCGLQSSGSKSRSLVVDVSEKSGYGVISEDALSSGNVLALIVNLRHK